jgi:hypothetical protein
MSSIFLYHESAGYSEKKNKYRASSVITKMWMGMLQRALKQIVQKRQLEKTVRKED